MALSKYLVRVVALTALIGGTATSLHAADIVTAPPGSSWYSEPTADFASRFEARFGVFAHGVGSVEQGTVALNGELVTPRVVNVSGPWAFLVPRFGLGGYVNLSGRTNVAYAAAVWTIPIFNRFFAEAFVGPAIHDGSFGPTATHAGLGCPVLFHAGASLGYRITNNFSVMGTFGHLSNGRELFGINCGTNQQPGGNQGLNQWGIRAGYTF